MNMILPIIITNLCIATHSLANTSLQDLAGQKPLLGSILDNFTSQENKMALRTQFHISGCTVRGYPSHGGIVTGTVTAAELEWLGLSRSQSSERSQVQTEEDDFCFQILRLGAQCWRSEAFYNQKSRQVTGGYPWPGSFPPRLHVGYPSTGGVWVLKLLNGQDLPDEFAKVQMAFTMDERCDALKQSVLHSMRP